jgi:hypothetical protein
MAFRIALFFTLFTVGCSITKQAPQENTAKFKAEIVLNSVRPHCGGALLSLEDSQGRLIPIMNTDYFLIQSFDSIPDFSKYQTIKTNELGTIKVDLSEGIYHLFHKDKSLNIDAWLKLKQRQGENYKNAPESCFLDWKKRPDFIFEIKSDSTISLSERHRCFTGNNPCIEYYGPYPP